MDAVSDIAFFALLVKHGNLTSAARELDVTPPAVSRRLAMLENRLGIRLLNRTTRRVSLTYEGELYLEEGRRILDDLGELEQRVSSGHSVPRGLLRVNASFGFGREYVTPVVAEFLKAYPEVEVQLRLTDRPINLTEEGFDVCVHFGHIPDTRVVARKIASNQRYLCAAPAYLEKYGTPEMPADLRRHKCIVIHQTNAGVGSWRLNNGVDEEIIKVRGAVVTNDGDAAVAMALRGLGILERSEWHVAPYIRSGQLHLVLPEWVLPAADIYVVYPVRKNLSAKVRAFVDHLADSIAAHQVETDGVMNQW